ncbi:hypothetical protein D3C72_1997990 [compost metagenome]
MHEAPGRAGLVFALPEDRQFVLHRAVAQLAHPQAHFDAVGEGDGGEVVAGGADHEAHHAAVMDIQSAALDQVGVHRAVEVAVIDHVVHMAVEVVVVPAGGDRLEMAVVTAQVLGLAHGVSLGVGWRFS